MPAVDRLAKVIYEQALDVAKLHPSPETKKLVKLTANQMYGTQIGMAFMGRGAQGVRARQLLDEYESFLAFMTAQEEGAA